MADTAIFDFDDALDRAGGDRELLLEILEIVPRQAIDAITQLRMKVAEKDAAGIERLAHFLKGGLLNISAHEAAEAARRLEDIGRYNRMPEAQQALAAFEAADRVLQPLLVDAIRSLKA
ncbi:MAG: Hpt domain-containing protein [Myxococcales bacterium]